jgi:hypothetical protein
MKPIELFDEFINEAAKPRIDINASIWKDDKKMIVDKNSNSYRYFSNIVTSSFNNRYWSNSCVIVIEEYRGEYLIKMGYGTVSSTGEMKLQATVTAPAAFSKADLKENPTESAKKAANIFEGNLKKSLDMNFMPDNESAIFKIGKDLNKPIEDLILFTNKHI